MLLHGCGNETQGESVREKQGGGKEIRHEEIPAWHGYVTSTLMLLNPVHESVEEVRWCMIGCKPQTSAGGLCEVSLKRRRL